VKERIFRVGSEAGSVTLLFKEDPYPNPDPKLGRKWDPDPKKLVSDQQHGFKFTENILKLIRVAKPVELLAVSASAQRIFTMNQTGNGNLHYSKSKINLDFIKFLHL
jgi:hypothetical protein